MNREVIDSSTKSISSKFLVRNQFIHEGGANITLQEGNRRNLSFV